MADDIPGERWLPIPGYEGHYDVSDHGRVRSWKRGGPRILQPSRHRFGYPKVTLCLEGRQKTHLVPHLVMHTFIGAHPPGQEIRHLDGDPMNSHLTNLRYGTRSENHRDAVQHGTFRNRNTNKTHCVHDHPFTDANTYRTPDGRRRCRVCREADRKTYQARRMTNP